MKPSEIRDMSIDEAKIKCADLEKDDRVFAIEPIRDLLFSAMETPCVYFTSPNGKIAGMARVGRRGDS